MPYRRQNRNKSRTVNRKGASTRISGLNPRKSTYLTDSPFAKKGLTLRKLMRGTPNLMRENSRIVDILQLKRTQTRSGMPAVHARMRTRLPKKIIRETYIIGIQKDKNGNIPDKPINKHSKVLVSCTCLTGDTKVLTDKGWQTIYELAEPLTLGYYPIKYNVKGEFYNGSHPFYKGKEKVWKLKLSNGQEITATKDHKFLKYELSEEKWVELQNLKVEDKLVGNEETSINILDISYAGKQHVYDITVPKVNCFVANGILAHNCENFLFYWEWANTYHGASRIIYGNGQPPKVTNPQFAYGLCKHLYRLGMEMIENDL